MTQPGIEPKSPGPLPNTTNNTQLYKVRVKGKVEQSRERCSTLPYTGVVGIENGSLRVTFDFGRQLYYAH